MVSEDMGIFQFKILRKHLEFELNWHYNTPYGYFTAINLKVVVNIKE